QGRRRKAAQWASTARAWAPVPARAGARVPAEALARNLGLTRARAFRAALPGRPRSSQANRPIADRGSGRVAGKHSRGAEDPYLTPPPAPAGVPRRRA